MFPMLIANAAFKTAPDIINIGLVSTDPKYKSTLLFEWSRIR